MKGFFKELKRRRVWQVMVIYIAVAWGLVQAADTLLPIFEAPPWILKTFTVLLVLGFPVALLLAWAYDLTPGGIRRDDAPEDAAKSGNVQVETSGRSVPDKPTGHFESKASTQDHKSWVAVMPFKVTADDAEMSDLGAGLTEDISAGLARFAYLAVVAQESVTGSATKIGDVREFSRTLGARYVIAGSVRGSTGNIRVSVRLIEAAAGVDLWVENYTRNRVDSDLFATGDEIVARIVATIADSFGVLVGSMTRSIENKPETELTPNDWVLRTFDYLRLYSVQGHAQLRDGLEGAVMSHPRNAEVRACLAQLYLNEYNFGFNPRPDSLNRALREADLAIELDSTSLLANQQLAQVHFFSRNLSGFRHAAERTLCRAAFCPA